VIVNACSVSGQLCTGRSTSDKQYENSSAIYTTASESLMIAWTDLGISRTGKGSRKWQGKGPFTSKARDYRVGWRSIWEERR